MGDPGSSLRPRKRSRERHGCAESRSTAIGVDGRSRSSVSCNTGCASTHSPRPAGANASDTCPAGANASGTCPAGTDASGTCPAGTDASGTCPAGTDAPGAHSPAAAAGARGRRLGARAGTLRRLPQQAIPPRQHSRDDE